MAHPACRPVWIDRRPAPAAAIACALVATACSRDPQPTDRRVAVVPSRTAASAARVAVAPPTASASPTPDPPRSPAPPRRAFVDPPLPPELVDPPGLKPLPPRPSFTDDRQGEMP